MTTIKLAGADCAIVIDENGGARFFFPKMDADAFVPPHFKLALAVAYLLGDPGSEEEERRRDAVLQDVLEAAGIME